MDDRWAVREWRRSSSRRRAGLRGRHRVDVTTGHRTWSALAAALVVLVVSELARAADLPLAPSPASPESEGAAHSPAASPASAPAAGAARPLGAARSPPSAAAVAAAKRLFGDGMKLYREGLYRAALSKFLAAKELAPRASMQRNIAQSYRDLREFAAAYAAYEELLRDYGAELTPADRRTTAEALAELRGLTAEVQVTVREPGAAVNLDGKTVATTPCDAPLRIDLGEHVLTVEKEGFVPIERRLSLRGREALTLPGPMERNVGVLFVTAKGAARGGEQVWVDGEHRGSAPLRLELPPGEVMVQVRTEGAETAPERVLVRLGEIVSVPIALDALPGTLAVDPGDPFALVAVDGRLVGLGAWSGPLPPGEHRVAVTRDGFEPRVRAVTVVSGETRRVEDLVPLARGGAPPESPGPEPPPGQSAPKRAVYSLLSLSVPLGLDVRNSFSTQQTCSLGVAGGAARCDAGTDVGLGLSVAVGYRLGWLGVEVFGYGSGDESSASRQVQPGTAGAGASLAGDTVPRTEDYRLWRYGGGGGLALRAFTSGEWLRVTGAVGGGAVVRGMQYRLDTETLAPAPSSRTAYSSETATYVAPLLRAETGVLLGSASGVQLYLGAVFLAEFAPSRVSVPSAAAAPGASGGSGAAAGAVDLQRGMNLSLGPILGIQLGL